MPATNIFNQISQRIIKEQALIIGPIAWDEAKKVPGITVDSEREEVTMTQSTPETVNSLVAQYTKLFGKASVEACKDAVADLLVELPQDQVPTNLR